MALPKPTVPAQKLAPKYFGTRFLRVFVENVPWLVEKLAIQVLPCVVCFMDGVTKDRFVPRCRSPMPHYLCLRRLVGFEELGNNDEFETATMEWRLLNCGKHCPVLDAWQH